MFTFTVVLEVTLPPGPEAWKPYVVVSIGFTATSPLTADCFMFSVPDVIARSTVSAVVHAS